MNTLSASARQARREGPVAGLLLTVVLGALVAANRNALAGLFNIWTSEGHSSEFLVLAVAAWLLWRVRHEIAAIRFRADWRGLLLVAPAGAGLLLANLIDVRAAQLALLLVAVCGVVWCVLGRAALRIAAYPIGFLFLALPVWDSTKPLLQEMTVHVTEFVLRTVGIPVFVDETYINIPSGTVVVLAGCSGAQFFQAGVTLGVLFAFLNFRKMWTRTAVVALFGVMVILGNWLRVLTLVFLGPQSELQHVNIGWGVFVVSVVPAFWLASRLRTYEDAVWPSRGAWVTAGDADDGSSTYSVSRLTAIAGLTVVLLVGMPLAADRYIRSLPEPDIRLMPLQPNAPWSGPYEADDGWRPLFNNAASDAIATYRSGDREVTLYVAYYGSQDQGAEAVNEENTVYDPENWHPRGDKASGTLRRIVVGKSNRTLGIVETHLDPVGGGSERLVWHWFRVAGRDAAVPWRAKLLQIAGLAERRDDAVAIVLSAVGSDFDDARNSVGDFLKANFVRIGAMVNPEPDTYAVRDPSGA